MPFIQTALIGDDESENINHYGAVRFRVNGSASVLLAFYNLDDQLITSLVPLTISENPGREPTRLSNFISQRARLKVSTDLIDETMKVNRIIIFVRPMWTSFPE